MCVHTLLRATQASSQQDFSLLAQLMAELTIRAGQWDPDPDWFEEHCPVCGEESLEGDIERRVITIEFKKWVEQYENGGRAIVLRRKIIRLDVTCWFHTACLDIYVTRTGGA